MAAGSSGVIPMLTVGDTASYTTLDISKDVEANDVYGALEGLVKYGPEGQPEPARPSRPRLPTPPITCSIYGTGSPSGTVTR